MRLISHYTDDERCQMPYSCVLSTICSSGTIRCDSTSSSVHKYDSLSRYAIVVVVVEPFPFLSPLIRADFKL